MALAHATVSGADGGEYQQFHPGIPGGIGDVFALADLAI